MEMEFDCPQFYDFENQIDESHPEIYFETRHTNTFSPYSSATSAENSASFHGFSASDGKPSSLPTSSSKQPYNTRSSVKKEMDRMSERMFKVVSHKFQPTKEPPNKKSKMTTTVQKIFKKPLPLIKKERVKSSVTSARDRRRRPGYNLRSRLPLKRTVPEPFAFSTDSRIKTEPNDIPEYKPVDFITTLRSNKENQYQVKKGPVRAVPDRLLRKRKIIDKKTMAEKVLSFQQGLANRERPATPPGEKRPRLTRPMTPHLRVAERSRPVYVISQEEKEIQEAEEIKKYHFKAQPVDPRTMVPFVLKPRNKVENLEPVNVNLWTERRAALRPRAKSVEIEPLPEFHARPVPRKILEGIRGLGEKAAAKTTEPLSPPFLLKRREEIWKQIEESKQREAEAAAAAEAAELKKKKRIENSFSTSSLQSSFKKPKATVPAPFSFHTRDQGMLAHKEEKIQYILDEEKRGRQFKANPMPSPSVTGVPQRKKISPTKIQSFSLEADNSRTSKWQKRVEEQKKLEKEATVFKANPCTVTLTQPFMPARSSRPVTEFATFDLHSDSRASERNKYEQKKKQKQEEITALMEEQRREEEEREKKEIAELRAKTVHKAQPALNVEPFKVKRGLIPATEPLTPKFETDRRLKRKHE